MSENAMYDFVVNDEDEVMLLLYAGKTEPSNARFVINATENKAELYRNENECVVLENIPDDIFDSFRCFGGIVFNIRFCACFPRCQG